MENTELKISEILSPICNHEDKDRLKRVTGRFGYQMLADSFSFSQNTSQRLLIISELERLPELILELLNNSDMKKSIQNEFNNGMDQSTFDDFYNTILEKFKGSDLDDFFNTVNSLSIKAWEKTTKRANGVGNIKNDESNFNYSKNKENSDFHKVFLIILPHLERQIWLTEMSAPLPIHAVTRFYDIWSAFILIWCYKNITKNKVGETNQEQEHKNKIEIEAFNIKECIYITIVDGWKINSWQRDETREVRVVIGPYFLDNKGNNKLYYKFFLEYMNIASSKISGWEDRNSALPKQEELHELYKARLPVTPSELELRIKTIIESWKLVNNAKSTVESPTRTDWELLGAALAWCARWYKYLPPDDYIITYKEWKTKFKCLHIFLPDDINKCNLIFTQSESYCNNDSTDKIINLKKEKQYTGLDTPNVMLNRMRERQSSNWSKQLISINNLINRHTNTIHKSKPFDFLKGAGGKICWHLLSITTAHNVNIYWVDYTKHPSKLTLLNGYSKLVEHQANREIIFDKFDKKAYGIIGNGAKSQIYRVLATNKAERVVISDEETNIEIFNNIYNNSERNERAIKIEDILELSGYDEKLKPKSAIALPIRQNGKIVGVLELNGLVDNQFSQRLFAPLFTATNLIGPFLYSNVQLYYLALINDWVTDTPSDSIKLISNPLEKLANYLCNIFLCPMIQIWLADDDDKFYVLKGDSHKLLIKKSENFEFKVNSDNNIADAENAFANIAINICQSKEKDHWGQFAKALYVDAGGKTVYELEKAITTGIYLYNDFINGAPELTFRKKIFSELKLKDIATFPIFKKVGNSHVEVIGIVILHDYGSSSAQKDGEIISQFSTGWQPTIEYFQKYLPTVLEQVQLYHSQYQNSQRILMHQAIHEISEIEKRLPKLNNDIDNLLNFGKEIIITAYRTGIEFDSDKVIIQKTAHNDLNKVISMINTIKRGENYVAMDDFSKRINILSGKLKTARHITYLKEIDLNIPPTDIDLFESLQNILASHKKDMKLKAIDFQLYGFFPDNKYILWVQKNAWTRILYNLISNMTKYSSRNTNWSIELNNNEKKLVLRNLAETHVQDNAEILTKINTRGRLSKNSAIDGDGLGLYDVKVSAEFLAIDFNYSIQSSKKENPIDTFQGIHRYELGLQNVLNIIKNN